jgi:hypothetical protein
MKLLVNWKLQSDTPTVCLTSITISSIENIELVIKLLEKKLVFLFYWK